MSTLQAYLSKEELALIIASLRSDSTGSTEDVASRLEGLWNAASNFAVVMVHAFVVQYHH